MAEAAELICPFSKHTHGSPEPRHTGQPDGWVTAPPRIEAAREPICQFYRIIPGIPDMKRADRSADGTLATNGFRYCEPLTAASGFGWHVYPPMNFTLIWSGDEVAFALGRTKRFTSLRGVQYPGFPKAFADVAPDGLKDSPPPFLTQGLMPGSVKIWSGYFARTAPDWALLSRGVANKPKTQPYENYEGIIEGNSWFGPLFTNVQIKRTNSPIQFHMRYPFFQVQPLRRECYQQPPYELCEAADLNPEDWRRFAATIEPNRDQMRALGHHAVEVRRELRRQS
jgi:hypothetical protein